MNKKNALTPQQKRFLNEYSKTLDVDKSALTAGYGTKTARIQARELLGKKRYVDELNAITEQKADYLEVSRAFVVKKYLQLIDWASGNVNGSEAEGRLDHGGDLRSFATPKDPAILLRALDGLCKYLNNEDLGAEKDENTMLTKIIGLNQEKI